MENLESRRWFKAFNHRIDSTGYEILYNFNDKPINFSRLASLGCCRFGANAYTQADSE
jgi:hypothetical protein